MHLSVLRLRHFRNLGEQELSVPPEGVAIVGSNAQGKTNLLEAIYFLETFRSFRGASSEELTCFGEPGFWVSGTTEGVEEDVPVGSCEITAGFRRDGRKRKITVDGVEQERVSDALGSLAAVIFSPSDVGIISEGPHQRRRFLDILLSLNEPEYLSALQKFRHVLSQRNAALKASESAAVIRAWDGPFVESAAQVMKARHRWVEVWHKKFSQFYSDVSGGRSAHLRYVPRFRPEDWAADALKSGLRSALDTTWDADLRNRTSGVGPHRDDLSITVDGEAEALEVRRYGSGGQRRTAALALRLVEAATVRTARGREPLVLMDDVFAELDAERSERILHLIAAEETGQVILTAPKENDVGFRADRLVRWRIDQGRIQA